ncbi:MAG: hypothetical protein C0506_13600 [Anaerolinea sp.]|nr:hypothetical protein [Anaerolinea sp.]
MSRPSIAILGLPYFGRMLSGLLSERGWAATFYPHPGRDLRGWAKLAPALLRADIVYLIGSRIEKGSPQDRMLQLRRKPVAIHWVGTDVLIASEEHARGRVSGRVATKPAHWCDAPWLVDELRAIGVRSSYLPLPIPLAAVEAPPLPDQFRVLLYLPVDAFDREVFDIEALLRLPPEFPEIPFTLIPSPAETLPGPLPPNLEARGWVTYMDALYRTITVVVRLTSHDGMSFMVAESLARERYAIWTFPLEGAIQSKGFEEVSAALRELLRQHRSGELRPNHAGRDYVLRHFDRDTLLTGLDNALRALL